MSERNMKIYMIYLEEMYSHKWLNLTSLDYLRKMTVPKINEVGLPVCLGLFLYVFLPRYDNVMIAYIRLTCKLQ